MRVLALALVLAVLSTTVQAQSNGEAHLLHTPLNPALLSNFRIWDSKLDRWRPMRRGEAPGQRAPVLVLHIWADYCAPCRDEFPLVRDFAKQIETKYRDQVEFLYLSETSGSIEMAQFYAQQHGRMPQGPHYQDSNEAIAAQLRQRMPTGEISLPTTVLLDEQRVVRQVVIGSIGQRRTDLSSGISHLVALTQHLRKTR